MSRNISTELAPAAIGPYVQGVDLGSMIIISGQIRSIRKTGAVADDVAAQARQSLENVKAIVEAAGLIVADIVKTTVFVKDLNDFATVNAAYEAFYRAQRAVPGPLLRGSGASAKRREDRNRSHRRASLIDTHANHGQCRLAVFIDKNFINSINL